MKKIFLLLCLGMMLSSVKASVTAYFNYGVFNIPSGKPFLETYLTVIGKSIRHVKTENGYQGSVNIRIAIYSGEKLVIEDKYNLMSPVDKDTLNMASFIDDQRYSLPNGTYRVELTLTDNNDTQKKSFTHKENVTINFIPGQISCSSIQPLENFVKTQAPSVISKSGYDLIPYNVNYYPASQNVLKFYFEAYGTDTVLGPNKNFVYSYFIERKEDMYKPQGMSGFKKQLTGKVNPLLAQVDISKLESGNYYLVVQIRDADSKLQLEKKWFFQRESNYKDLNASANNANRSVYEFFGNYTNADTLKMFVECLWPISTTMEREWGINVSVKKDPELMKKYIVDFWQKKAGDSLDPLQMWLSYYTKVMEVNNTFKCGKQKGYYTDRGRVYLQYGKPSQRVMRPSDNDSYPYEIWQYYRLEDKATGQFFTNKKFVFVNKMVADDCYWLIHSDVRGEQNNPQWQYEIQKSDNTDRNNIDKTKPDGKYGSNVDDFFNNPR